MVRENLATFYEAIEQGWESGLPEFVRAEFSRFLDCGVLERGFAHLACKDCGLPRLVAFTCAGRGFCPTCLGRRMNQTTLNLLAHVLPAQPLRQWVVTLPFPLRAPLAYGPGLMALVARVFEDSLLRWYRHRLAPGDPTAQGGLLTVIQRSSGDMRLNPHLHVVALDGAYVAGPDGQPVFRELPRLKTSEVADVVQITKVRVLKALERRGVVRVSPESLEIDDVLSARDPVLAHLAAAAVAGLPPAGLPPNASAAPCSSRCVASLRSSASSWCKTTDSTCTQRPTPVLSTTRPEPGSCATSYARHLPRNASPSCPTTVSA